MERNRTGIPELMKKLDGTPVTSSKEWQERRKEILSFYQDEVFGRMPDRNCFDERFEVTEQPALNGKAIDRKVVIRYTKDGREGKIRTRVFVPTAGKKPVPAFIIIIWKDPTNLDWHTELKPGYWPVEKLIDEGFCAAAFYCTDCDSDEDDLFTSGVHSVFDEQPRKRTDWGAISAWAWGFSRVVDYMEQAPDIDAAHVGVVGQSRGGKTALWAGCCDERIWLSVSNDSGCLGAAMQHGNTGEQYHQIVGAYPFWFADSFTEIVRESRQLPMDQHLMLSLLAPRLLYVASATNDDWADPASEFLGAKMAGPAFEMMGGSGIPLDTPMPAPDSPIFSGNVGYHIRTGGHSLTEYDWMQFIRFAKEHLPGSLKGSIG